MTDRIKECPLCDGEAVVVETGRPYTLIRYFVSCNSCGLETARIYRTRKEAIKRWNTRKPMDSIVKRLEEVSFIDWDEKYIDNGECLIYLADAIEIVKGGKDNEK